MVHGRHSLFWLNYSLRSINMVLESPCSNMIVSLVMEVKKYQAAIVSGHTTEVMFRVPFLDDARIYLK